MPENSKLPPHNLEAERAVLGAILREPDVLADVQAVLRAESFFFDANQTIFRVFVDLANSGKPIDLVTVHAELKACKEDANVGGAGYLATLFDAAPTAVNVLHHANLVREASLLRGGIHVANELLRDAHDAIGPGEEILGRAERALSDLATEGSDVEMFGAPELVREALEAIDQRAAREGPDGLTTGFVDVDNALSGMKAGELIVLGARPGCGKSAMALAMATANSAAGTGVIFLSLEMSRKELMNRILSMRSSVGLRAIQRGKLTTDQSDGVNQAADEFRTEPFHIVTADVPVARLAAFVRRGVRRRGIGLLVVDYLQLMRPENLKDPRHLQVGTLGRRMKQLAMSCGIPVVLLAQLNRDVENRPDKKPRLSDLRDSGETEQHADIVLLLHPHPNQEADSPVCPTDVIIAKNRNGPVVEVTVAYRRQVVRFENAAFDPV